jgi:hypothetical protein
MVQKRTPFFGKHVHFLFGMVQKRMPFLREREIEEEREWVYKLCHHFLI